MKICDVCQQTVEQLQAGPKGMEKLDCCRAWSVDELQRFVGLESTELYSDLSSGFGKICSFQTTFDLPLITFDYKIKDSTLLTTIEAFDTINFIKFLLHLFVSFVLNTPV